MQLRRVDPAGGADGGNLFAAAHFLPFFNQQSVVMGISGNPAVVMTDEDQIAETFQFVAGISDGAAVGGFDGGPSAGLDIDAVVGPSFADGAVFGYDCPAYRPCKLGFAVFGNVIRT